MNNSKRKRSGVAMIVALVCVVVVGALCAAGLVYARTSHRTTQDAFYRIQADWIAQGGMEKAIVALAENPKYRGERWIVSIEEHGEKEPGVAEIKVVPEDNSKPGVVQVTAQFPADSERRATVAYERQTTLAN